MARFRPLRPFLVLVACGAIARAALAQDAAAADRALAAPEPEVAASVTQLATPELEVAAPNHGIAAPDPEVAASVPELAVAEPEVEAPEPEVEAETVIRGRLRPEAAAALAPGAAVTVVDAARFAGEAKGAAELLGTSPGVAVTDHGGIGRHTTVSIRGASADQVKVLLDGVPLNPVAGGGVDLSSIPPQWISRIEVVRGTEGVRHGSGALGGVVNVVTAAPRAGTWSAAATGGSFETWQADAQAGAGGDGWGVLGSVATSRSAGRFGYEYDDHDPATANLWERDHNASSLTGALLKAFLLGWGGRLDAAAQLSGGRRELPGTPRDPTRDDWQEDARGIVSARYQRPARSGLLFTAAGSTRIDRLSARLKELAGDVVRQRGVAATGSLGAEWSGARGSLEAAIEAGGERLRADGMGDHARATYALTLAGEVAALGGRARMGPGVRLERTGAHEGVSAKLGGSLAIAGPLSLRASAGRSFRAPSFAELYLQQGVVAPNPALRPEVGLGGDAAIVAEGRFGTASIGAFASHYRDLIVYQSVSFRRLGPENAARALVRGFEAELATVPARRLAGLSARAAYTFTEPENLRGRGDLLTDLPRKPRHRVYGRVGVGGDPADAHAEVQWISRQWLAFGRDAEIAETLTVGAGASVRLWKTAGLRLHLEVRNLLDERSLHDTYGHPLPGRTVLVTLRASDPKTERR
jgi:iron complex outermembrane receptor protein